MSKYQNFGPLFNLPVVPVPSEVREGQVRYTDTAAVSNSRYDGQTISDVCANRHKGNFNSKAAFKAISDRLTEQQNRVMKCLRDRPDGLIAEEIAEILGVTVNCISGRCSELKRAQRIFESGKRLTRSGSPAAILKVT